MSNKWTIISSVSGFTGVALGAIGAHLLKSRITPELLDNFNTGVFYQLIHTIAILAVSLSGIELLAKANKFFMTGIILFSFSLYIYSLTAYKPIAMITPFGGVSFLIGWIYLSCMAYRHQKIKA